MLVFCPEPSYVWQFVVIAGPGTLQCDTDGVQQFNFLRVIYACVESAEGFQANHLFIQETVMLFKWTDTGGHDKAPTSVIMLPFTAKLTTSPKC